MGMKTSGGSNSFSSVNQQAKATTTAGQPQARDMSGSGSGATSPAGASTPTWQQSPQHKPNYGGESLGGRTQELVMLW